MRRGAILGLLAAALCACAPPVPAVRIETWRAPGPLAAPTERGTPALRAAIIGDFGDPTPRQALVARAVLGWNDRHPLDLVLQPGDNVYPCGPDPVLPGAERCAFAADGATVVEGFSAPDDPAFLRNEAALSGLRRPDGDAVPAYLALGNHDIGHPTSCRIPGLPRGEAMRRRACLEVAHRSPQWRIPARHYVLDEGHVRFIVVDSNVAVRRYAGFTLAAEEAFVREASAPCDARLCFLVAHHPPAHAVRAPGVPGVEPSVARMRRLAAAAGGRLAAVLAGHVHTLEHLTLPEAEVIIAGSTARGGDYAFAVGWPRDARLHFATSAAGFGVLEVWSDGWGVRFVDAEQQPVHCCEAEGRGPCRPVACADAP